MSLLSSHAFSSLSTPTFSAFFVSTSSLITFLLAVFSILSFYNPRLSASLFARFILFLCCCPCRRALWGWRTIHKSVNLFSRYCKLPPAQFVVTRTHSSWQLVRWIPHSLLVTRRISCFRCLKRNWDIIASVWLSSVYLKPVEPCEYKQELE